MLFRSTGETSGSVLRAMGLGRPVIVFDHGWYSELPDDACYKVPPMDKQALFRALVALAASPDFRRSIGQRAQEIVCRHHNPSAAAEQFVDFVQYILSETDYTKGNA